MNREQPFLDLVQQALRITHNPIWLDHVFHDTYLVGFENASGLFLLAHKPSTPRELAVQLAIRQIEADAYSAFKFGSEQAKVMRNLPPSGVMQ